MSPRRSIPLAALAFAALTLAPAPAAALEFVADEDIAADSVLGDVTLDAEIAGRYVAGTLTLTLTGATRPAGALRFPLPAGAVLYEAAVWVPAEERWAIAETVGRRQGQAAFEETPREPDRSPLLVQDIGGDLYRARIHAPDDRGEVRIRLRYAHLVERDGARWTVRVAMHDPDLDPGPRVGALAVTLRIGDGWTPRAWRAEGVTDAPAEPTATETGVAVRLDGRPLDADLWLDLEPTAPVPPAVGLRYVPSARSLDAALAQHGIDPMDGIAALDDLPAEVRRRLTPHTHLRWRPDLDDAPAPRRVVFVFDVSGSMSGPKLEETRQGVGRLLERLGADDRFGLVAFDTEAMVFRPALAGAAAVPEARRWLDRGRGGGGTDVFAGLQAAADLDDGPLDLVLITDGQVNTGPTDAEGILRRLGAGHRPLRLFAFGIGVDLRRGILVQLVERTGGEAAFALDDAEITGALFALFDRARPGGVLDAALAIDGREARPVRPVLPGDEVEEGVIDSTPRAITLTGVRAGEAIERRVELPSLPESSEGIARAAAPLVAAVWIRRFEREIDRVGEDPARLDAAVRLARAYGIVSRYSSLLALTDEAAYAERGIQRVPRDPAGLALIALAGSDTDERRIGGQGAEDTWAYAPYDPAAAGTADVGSVGCRATPGPLPPRWPLALLLLPALAGLRRRR